MELLVLGIVIALCTLAAAAAPDERDAWRNGERGVLIFPHHNA